jgi:branched-chain amino acid transport system permease protein
MAMPWWFARCSASLIERLAYRPLRGGSNLAVLITAIGVSLLLETPASWFLARTPRPFRRFSRSEIFTVRPDCVKQSTAGLLRHGRVAGRACNGSFLKTKIGTAMRAVSFNHQAASLVGINNDRVISFTFGLGSALAAAGGILYSP